MDYFETLASTKRGGSLHLGEPESGDEHLGGVPEESRRNKRKRSGRSWRGNKLRRKPMCSGGNSGGGDTEIRERRGPGREQGAEGQHERQIRGDQSGSREAEGEITHIQSDTGGGIETAKERENERTPAEDAAIGMEKEGANDIAGLDELDELGEGDVELLLDEDEEGESKEIENDGGTDEPEQDEPHGEHLWEFIEESEIQVEMERDSETEKELLQTLQSEVSEICQNIRLKTGVFRNTDVTLEHLVDLFLPSSLVLLFSRVMKSTMVSRAQQVVRPEEMAKAFKVLLCCAFYGVSLTKVFEPNHFQYFPLIEKAGVRIEEKRRIMEVLKGLEGVAQRHRGSSWDATYGADRELLECERELSRAASSIGYTQHSFLSTDDDHLRMRRHHPADTGFAQVHNPSKAFGPVQHSMVSSLTQMWLAGHYQSVIKESATRTVQTLLQYATGSMDAESITVRDQRAVVDRGYLCPSLISYFNRIGLHYMGTHRRDKTFPFTFGNWSQKRSSTWQKVVEERGARARYWARCSSTRGRGRRRHTYSDYALAYRDGAKGNVALMATNDPGLVAGRLVFKVSRGQGGATALHQEAPECLKELEKSLVILTRGQGGQEWFILRAFRFTSSTVTPALRMAERLLKDCDEAEMCGEEEELLEVQGVLNIRGQRLGAPISNEGSSYTARCSIHQLKSMCRERGLRLTGNKGELIKRLTDYERGPVHTRKTEFLRKLFSKWFMRPISSHELSLGRSNEELVARGLIPFLRENASHLSPRNLHFRGLVCRTYEPWMASSVDALLVFSPSAGGGERVGCMEIKTMTTRNTLQSARDRGKNGRYREILFDDIGAPRAEKVKLFQELVPSVEHRAQLLHHCATFQTLDAFYCFSSLTKIIYVVRVVFSDATLRAHSNILNAVVRTQLRWIYEEEEFPSFEGFSKSDFCWAGHRDAVLFTLKMWKALTEMVMRLKEPLPRAHYIRPRLVFFWNTVKGGVDVYSRIMSHTGFQIKGLGSKAAFYIRAFLTAIYNTHICRRLLMAEGFLDQYTGSYTASRKRINQFGSMKDTILEILEGNCLSLDGRIFRECAFTTLATPRNLMLESRALNVSEEELKAFQESIPTRRTNLSAFFEAWSSPVGIKCRQTGVHRERLFGSTSTGKQMRKWCRYCSRFEDDKDYGYRTAYYCPGCFDTPLCKFVRKDARGRRNPQAKSCFDKWHESTVLRHRATNVRGHRRGGLPDPRLKVADSSQS